MKLFQNQSIPSFHRSDRVLQSHQQKTTSPLSLSLFSNPNITTQTEYLPPSILI